jgi:hypothetical protein
MGSRQGPSEDAPAAEALFRSLRDSFQRAAQAAGETVRRSFRIGGYSVHFEFAGRCLLPAVTPALEHLAMAPAPQTDLTIRLWDSASTGTPIPELPWTPADYARRGDFRRFREDGCVYSVFQPVEQALSLVHLAENEAIYWVPDGRGIPYYDRCTPVRDLLHVWMAVHGRQMVHSAAVGTPSGGVLIPGKGGSGKSSTALTCLDSDLRYVGDDYVLIELDPTPYVHSLYNSGKVDAQTLADFPHLSGGAANPDRLDTEKALFFLAQRFPEKMAAGFPIRAILVPRITGAPETCLRPLSGAASLAALAPSTVLQLTGSGHRAFECLAEFARRLPCYALELGSNRAAIPEVILDLLRRGEPRN